MSTFIVDEVKLEIPGWVNSLDTFRRWTDREDFPEKGNIWWLQGEVWADMSKEQIFTHGQVKGEFFFQLKVLLRESDSGILLPDGALVINLDADLSGNPDATFISHEACESGRVTLTEGREHGYTEVVGSPEMVLEVVSDSSVEKDTEILRKAYFLAGIEEYWLVDARGETISFEILRRGAKGFVSVRKQEGWLKSGVFGKSFRLLKSLNRLGYPQFRLESR